MASRNRQPARRAPAEVRPTARSRTRGAAILVGALVAIGAGVAFWLVSRPTTSRGPNLILITIDTLRADHVGAYGATTGATPTLDALARRGARFDQVQ